MTGPKKKRKRDREIRYDGTMWEKDFPYHRDSNIINKSFRARKMPGRGNRWCSTRHPSTQIEGLRHRRSIGLNREPEFINALFHSRVIGSLPAAAELSKDLSCPSSISRVHRASVPYGEGDANVRRGLSRLPEGA